MVAGSSVGSFDLRVLSERFPATRALCSYRTYDVSAVNEFAVRLGVESRNTTTSAASSEHRALADIQVNRPGFDGDSSYRDSTSSLALVLSS